MTKANASSTILAINFRELAPQSTGEVGCAKHQIHAEAPLQNLILATTNPL